MLRWCIGLSPVVRVSPVNNAEPNCCTFSSLIFSHFRCKSFETCFRFGFESIKANTVQRVRNRYTNILCGSTMLVICVWEFICCNLNWFLLQYYIYSSYLDALTRDAEIVLCKLWSSRPPESFNHPTSVGIRIHQFLWCLLSERTIATVYLNLMFCVWKLT